MENYYSGILVGKEVEIMWRKKCNIETNENICPICGETTAEDLPVEVYWCSHCKTPILQVVNQSDIGACRLRR